MTDRVASASVTRTPRVSNRPPSLSYFGLHLRRGNSRARRLSCDAPLEPAKRPTFIPTATSGPSAWWTGKSFENKCLRTNTIFFLETSFSNDKFLTIFLIERIFRKRLFRNLVFFRKSSYNITEILWIF